MAHKLKLSDIKQEIQSTGQNRGKFLYMKENTKRRVRFLTDFEDGIEILFHNSYEKGIDVPCQETFGRDCPYCDIEDESFKHKKQYAWCVYDYESKSVKILMCKVNNCTPVPALANIYETYGTLCDRDYEIKRSGSGTNTAYTVLPLEKVKFKVAKVKALSEQGILKAIDKAYPCDESEDDEDERPKKKKKAPKAKSKKAQEEEEDTEEEEDAKSFNDYENMSAKSLYKLCKERDIDVKPKKEKEYYIDLLVSADENEEEDSWDTDEETEEDWEDE